MFQYFQYYTSVLPVQCIITSSTMYQCFQYNVSIFPLLYINISSTMYQYFQYNVSIFPVQCFNMINYFFYYRIKRKFKSCWCRYKTEDCRFLKEYMEFYKPVRQSSQNRFSVIRGSGGYRDFICNA